MWDTSREELVTLERSVVLELRHIWLFRVGPRVQRFYKNLSAIREALVKKLVSGRPFPAVRRKSPRASSKTSSVPPRSKGGKFTRNDVSTRVSNFRRKRWAEDSPVPVEGEAQQFEGDPVLYPRYDPRYPHIFSRHSLLL